MLKAKNKYRVFISYSHEDRNLVKQIASILEENGLQPMLDDSFASGRGFTDQIKSFIAHAHVFMPVITKESSHRGWVHQEIGYAMALNIPVLPVCRGEMPGQMISHLQAVRWDDTKNWRRVNREKLSEKNLESVVLNAQQESRPLFEAAEYQEDRTAMMVEYAKRVLTLGFHGHVRQKSGLGSFNIPGKPITDSAWSHRYGDSQPSAFRLRLQLQERLVLETHARKAGCSLIIDPTFSYEKYGKEAKKARLRELLSFLHSIPDDNIRVALVDNTQPSESLTIVGDWFLAESVSATIGKGIRQTIFTRHAPSIKSKLEMFDKEMEELIKNRARSTKKSKKYAVQCLSDILASI
jgi:hypothetical protein